MIMSASENAQKNYLLISKASKRSKTTLKQQPVLNLAPQARLTFGLGRFFHVLRINESPIP